MVPTEFFNKHVVISDLHIKNATDQRYRLLLRLIDDLCSPKNRPKTLILLGDVFDFCFGYSKSFRKEFSHLGEKLSALALSGVRVFFLEGNHEFALKNLGWPEIDFVTQDVFFIETSAKQVQKIGLCHGDLINAPWHYYIFRRFIKSTTVIWAARLLPDKIFNALCNRLADSSRAMEKYRSINHQKLLSEAAKWLEREEVLLGIMGHFHVPYAETVTLGRSGKDGQIFCLPSWTLPNALVFDDEHNFYRVYITEEGYNSEPVSKYLSEEKPRSTPIG